jgi:hypothetical protein
MPLADTIYKLRCSPKEGPFCRLGITSAISKMPEFQQRIAFASAWTPVRIENKVRVTFALMPCTRSVDYSDQGDSKVLRKDGTYLSQKSAIFIQLRIIGNYDASCKLISRVGPRPVGAPDRLNIWRPFKPIFFELFRPRTGLAKFLRARAQTADKYR